MIEAEFFDTNILLYAKIDDGTLKHKTAVDLLYKKIKTGEPCISIQVINEFTANAIRLKYTLPEIERYVKELLQTFNIISLTANISIDAFRIAKHYQFSFWDSLIVAAALKANCAILYTEYLQDGQIIDSELKIINPFITKEESTHT